MIKVIHIHSYRRPLKLSWIFDDHEQLLNLNVLLATNFETNKFNESSISEDGDFCNAPFDWVINNLPEYHVVVLYDLCEKKAKIAELASSKQIVLWRLFGHEVYNRYRNNYLTDLTLDAKKISVFSLPKFSKEFIYNAYKFLKSKLIFNQKLDHIDISSSKIDYVLCLFDEEYVHIKSRVPSIPPFIKLPRKSPGPKRFDKKSIYNKKDRILIGNSRSSYNNHLDVIELVTASEINIKYRFYLPFAYGPDNFYTTKLRQRIDDKNNFYLIEEFLDRSSYVNFFNESSAFILNSYRPMAMGNLTIACITGLKIYLNSKNPTFHWMKRLGYHVSCFDEIKEDLKKGSISLTYEQALDNYELRFKESEDYHKHGFLEKVLKLIP